MAVNNLKPLPVLSTYYVHRNYANYLAYGLNTAEEGNEDAGAASNFQGLINSQLSLVDQLKQEEGDIRDSELEALYNDLLFGDGNDKGQEDFRQAVRQIIEEQLTNGFKLEADNISKATYTGNPDIDPYGAALQNAMTNFKESTFLRAEVNNRTLLSTIDRLHSEINAVLDELEKIGVTGFPNRSMGSSQGKALRVRREAIRNDVNNLVNDLIAQADGAKSFANIGPNQANPSFQRLLDYCSAIRQSGLGSVGALANMQGLIGEMLSSAVQYYGSDFATSTFVEEVRKAIQEGTFTLGDGYSTVQIKLDTGEYDIAGKAKSFSVSNDMLDVEFNKRVRNKTDVVVNLKKIIGQDNGPLNVSVKNYRSFNGLTIVNGTPLADILLSAGGAAFAANYANVLVGGEVQTMNEFLQAKIVQIALEGYDQTNKPTIFLVINSAKKEVRVYNIPALLGWLLKTQGSNTIDMNFKGSDGALTWGGGVTSGLPNSVGNIPSEFGALRISMDSLFSKCKLDVHISVGSV